MNTRCTLALCCLTYAVGCTESPQPVKLARAELDEPQLVVGPEMPLGAPVFGSRSQQTQQEAAAAWDGNNYFVVWNDVRAMYRNAIYGARVTPDGRVLDPDGIQLSKGTWVSAPDVAFDGTNYVVTWAEHAPFVTNQQSVVARRVGPAGELLEPAPIQLATAQDNGAPTPQVSATSGQTLIAWAEPVSGQIKAAHLPPNESAPSPPFVVATEAGSRDLVIANSSTEFLLVWKSWEALRGARLAFDSTVAAAPFTIADSRGDNYGPAVASDGAGFLVAWPTADSSRGYDGLAHRTVSPEGAMGPVFEMPMNYPYMVFAIDLAWREGRYLQGFTQYSLRSGDTSLGQTLGRYIAADGTPSALASLFSGSATQPELLQDLTAGDRNTAMIGLRTNFRTVINFNTDADWHVLGEDLLIARSANAQHRAQLASDGRNYLAVWEDNRDALVRGTDIYAQRLDANLAPLDPESFVIAHGEFAEETPAVVYGAGKYLVTWVAQSASEAALAIHGMVVDSSGARVGVQFSVETGSIGQQPPATVFDGTNFLIAWSESESELDERRVRAARVSPNGELVDSAPLSLWSSEANAYRVDAAFGAGRYFVVWTEYGTRESPAGATRGVLFDGGIGAVVPVKLTDYPADVQVVFDGDDFVVAWSRQDQEEQRDIFATRVSPSGSIRDGAGIEVVTDSADDTLLQMAFDGRQIWALWSRPAAAQALVGRFTVRGFAGEPRAERLFSVPDREVWAPHLTTAGPGRAAVAYERFSDEPLTQVTRTYGRSLIALGANGQNCDAPSECASGFCENRVCCERACAGECEACDTAEAPGKCVALPNAQEGGACIDPPSTGPVTDGSAGGSAGQAGAPPIQPDPRRENEGGCSCRSTDSSGQRRPWLLIASAALVGARRRFQRTRARGVHG